MYNNDANELRRFMLKFEANYKENLLSIAQSNSDMISHLDAEDRQSMDKALIELVASKIDYLISFAETTSSRVLAGTATGAAMALYDEANKITQNVIKRSYSDDISEEAASDLSTITNYINKMNNHIDKEMERIKSNLTK